RGSRSPFGHLRISLRSQACERRLAFQLPPVKTRATKWISPMVAARAADYVQPSATKIGLTALWKAATLVEKAGATCVPHVPYFGPGFLASLHVLAAKERESALERFFCDLAAMPYAATVPIDNGFVQIPDAPGLGADPEPELMQFRA